MAKVSDGAPTSPPSNKTVCDLFDVGDLFAEAVEFVL